MAKLSLLSLKAGRPPSLAGSTSIQEKAATRYTCHVPQDLWRECKLLFCSIFQERSPLRTDFSLDFFLCARMNIWIVFFFFKIASVSCFPAAEFLEWDHPSKLLHMCMHMCVVCVHVKHTIPAQAALKVLEAHKWEFPSRKHFSGKWAWGMLII